MSRWSVVSTACAIFVLAFLLRLPSCGQSLWVDELHTAWVVADGFEVISGRAADGNQTPWYFWGLWSWVQIAGSSEISLRLPSVLAISLASSLLVWVGWRTTGVLAAGTLAGMILAVERNSLFYGTEARCYACVVFCVTVCLLGFVEVKRSGNERTVKFWVFVVGFAATFGVLLHVTAALVFVGLAVSLSGKQRNAAWLVFVGVAIAGCVTLANVSRVWQRREQWNAFGETDSVWDIAAMWPWLWMLLLPLMIVVLHLTQFRRKAKININLEFERRFLMSVWLCVIGVTFAVWLISFLDVAALWHRRYIVGVLPLICFAGALTWSLALRETKELVWLRWVGVGLIGVGLMWTQGPLLTLVGGETRLVRRQEEWRGCVSYLKKHVARQDTVWLAAELIESRWPEVEHAEEDERYLLFPVSSVYSLSGVKPIGAIDSMRTFDEISKWSERCGADETLWILVRRQRSRMAKWQQEFERSVGKSGVQAELIPFRKLTVVRVSG